ncbi:TetR family transcriptional regulator [Amycolatopsis sp. MtRt-6]|uniref:TetR family transcriptional regulator n=1 Tax=Amycolatopsis sp. MtRt-6 TaxID=2792782 RepID=UPI0035AB94C1
MVDVQPRIAARAGVNQQLISYYFDGKEGLYRAMSEAWGVPERADDPGPAAVRAGAADGVGSAREPRRRPAAGLVGPGVRKPGHRPRPRAAHAAPGGNGRADRDGPDGDSPGFARRYADQLARADRAPGAGKARTFSA